MRRSARHPPRPRLSSKRSADVRKSARARGLAGTGPRPRALSAINIPSYSCHLAAAVDRPGATVSGNAAAGDLPAIGASAGDDEGDGALFDIQRLAGARSRGPCDRMVNIPCAGIWIIAARGR